MSDPRLLPVTTDQSRSRPLTLLERPVIEQRAQIAHCLADSLSPVHAALFAEPNLLRGAIRWYTSVPGPVSRLVDGDPSWRVAAEGYVKGLVDAISALAGRLRASTRPADQAMGELLELALHGPRPEDIFWCGDQPVMVNWGIEMVGAPAGSLVHRLGGIAPAPVARMAPAALAAAVAPPVSAPPPREPPPTPAGRWRGLWPLPAALLALALLAVLAPLAWAGVASWLRLPGPEVCAIPSDRREAVLGLDALTVEEMRLRARLAELRNKIADRRAQCLRVGQGGPITDIEDRGRREHALTGDVEVWLAWNGATDLDLMVECPDGVAIRSGLYQNGQQEHCGGRLDVDMNCHLPECRHSDHPVEHVVWQAGKAAPGTYKIKVINFDGGPAEPFVVRLKKFGAVQDFPPGVSEIKAPVPVADFVVP